MEKQQIPDSCKIVTLNANKWAVTWYICTSLQGDVVRLVIRTYPSSHVVRLVVKTYPSSHVVRLVVMTYPSSHVVRLVVRTYPSSHVVRLVIKTYPSSHVVRLVVIIRQDGTIYHINVTFYFITISYVAVII
jgi:uncharacterized protein Veg